MNKIGNVATHHAIAMTVSRFASRCAEVRTSPAAQSSRHIHGAPGFAARKPSEGSTARSCDRNHRGEKCRDTQWRAEKLYEPKNEPFRICLQLSAARRSKKSGNVF